MNSTPDSGSSNCNCNYFNPTFSAFSDQYAINAIDTFSSVIRADSAVASCKGREYWKYNNVESYQNDEPYSLSKIKDCSSSREVPEAATIE